MRLGVLNWFPERKPLKVQGISAKSAGFNPVLKADRHAGKKKTAKIRASCVFAVVLRPVF